MVRVLLAAGADPQRRYDRGQTAMHRAAAGGHVRTVQLLLGAWGRPEVTADALMKAADLAYHMGTYAMLAFELRKRYPAEFRDLFEVEHQYGEPGALPRLSALLDAWAADTGDVRKEQAAVRAQLHDLGLIKQGV